MNLFYYFVNRLEALFQYLRRESHKRVYRRKLKFLGHNSRFTDKVEFSYPNNISIGDNTYINGGIITAGSQSTITIGNDCLISYNVHIRTRSHNHSNPDKLIRLQGEFEKDITIGNNVWIGYGVQLLPGVAIGDNVIIGAGAVVTKSIPSNEIWGGYRQNSLNVDKN